MINTVGTLIEMFGIWFTTVAIAMAMLATSYTVYEILTHWIETRIK